MTTNAPSENQGKVRNKGWTVTIAALSINLVLGVLYAWGVMAKALVVQWHWTKADAALPFTVSTAAFAIMMVVAGRLQDKVGPRKIAAMGGIVLGLGLVASSFAQSPLVMLATFGIIGGVGIGLGYSATTPPAIKWFPPSKKGVITGIVVSGVGLAAVYISPLTQFLLKATNIHQTFLILGLGSIVVVAVLAQLLANPPAGFQPAAPAARSPAARAAGASGKNLDWNEMLRTSQFYRLWAMFILAASAGLMIIAHVAIIAKEQARWEWGFVPVVLLAIFNTTGRVASGFLSDRIGRTQTMILAFTLQACNMFAFSHYTSAALLVFGSAFTGLCYGTIFTLMPAATADFYGIRNLGVNYGLVFTGFGVAGVAGPLVGGRIRDLTGSYSTSYVISAVMLLVGAALAYTTRAPAVVAAAELPMGAGAEKA
jgi:OFA family oxalate/formate antiporter-like MFS transporter